MLPLKDDIPTRSFPLVTVLLILVNLAVYVWELALWFEPGPGPSLGGERMYEAFIHEFGLIPCRFGSGCPPALRTVLAGAPQPWLTVFTSMFVHGGLFHVGGNMLYLWIFGNNVEDSMGKGRFLAFYLACGVAAASAQYLQSPASAIPMVGASGAVSGTLGAYLVLYPHARIWTLVVFGLFWRIIPVPALVVLGLWIVVQAVNSAYTFSSGRSGGVAFLAHVGGFVAGMLLIHAFRQGGRMTYRHRS